jgi:hypothetical protein
MPTFVPGAIDAAPLINDHHADCSRVCNIAGGESEDRWKWGRGDQDFIKTRDRAQCGMRNETPTLKK